MSPSSTTPERYIGLDIHKHYFVAVGLMEDLAIVLGPQRIQMSRLEGWARKHLTSTDAVAVKHDPHWKAEFERLQKHLTRSDFIMAARTDWLIKNN